MYLPVRAHGSPSACPGWLPTRLFSDGIHRFEHVGGVALGVHRVGVERGPDGRARRTTFVLADGAVHRVYTGVSPDGHARDVLVDLLDDGLVSL